ncbi:MAG: hypothetical protein AB7S72_12505 [Draconibacterium sp.]
MKRNNVKETAAQAMNPKVKRVQRKRKNDNYSSVLIADAAFLLALFKVHEIPLPPDNAPQLLITDCMAQQCSPKLQALLHPWLRSGGIAQIETGGEIFAETLEAPIHPGIHITEQLAIRMAQKRQLPIAAGSGLIVREAGRRNVATVSTAAMLDLLAANPPESKTATLHRVRKNKIHLTEAPALIAGNNSITF